MNQTVIYSAGSTAACGYASKLLGNRGFQIVYEPQDDIQYVLLDVPSVDQHGQLRGGKSLQSLLANIPKDVTLIGGILDHPLLAEHPKIDLLKEESYLKENARITAYCALQIISEALTVTFEEASILIIGWGRIGKILTSLLVRLGTDVTVASSDPRKIASLKALGVNAIETGSIHPEVFSAIVNTAPAPVLSVEEMQKCPMTAKIDLASSKGLGGPDVIWAKGLPGIHAPESSGKLIARSLSAHIREANL